MLIQKSLPLWIPIILALIQILQGEERLDALRTKSFTASHCVIIVLCKA